jgi:hypothetical protein
VLYCLHAITILHCCCTLMHETRNITSFTSQASRRVKPSLHTVKTSLHTQTTGTHDTGNRLLRPRLVSSRALSHSSSCRSACRRLHRCPPLPSWRRRRLRPPPLLLAMVRRRPGGKETASRTAQAAEPSVHTQAGRHAAGVCGAIVSCAFSLCAVCICGDGKPRPVHSPPCAPGVCGALECCCCEEYVIAQKVTRLLYVQRVWARGRAPACRPGHSERVLAFHLPFFPHTNNMSHNDTKEILI